MGLKCTTTADQLKKIIEEKLSKIDTQIINTLTFCGEKAVAYARQNGTYIDRTGNLRSSIGYIIAKNGVVITESTFSKVSGTETSSDNGSDIGRNYARELVSEHSNGYVLIVVAGMHYAYYVEKIHNRDVIDGAKINTEKVLKTLIKQIK